MTPASVPDDTTTPYATVFDEELKWIGRRRQPVDPKEPDDDLTGLALSGGGIRSATVCLGFLQGLADLGLLKRFDYLSTVSGGGYIGAWLSAWIRREAAPLPSDEPIPANSPQAADPLRRVEQQLCTSWVDQARGRLISAPEPAEPQPIFHLRTYSNYLAPKLGLDSPDVWVMVAIFVRNLLLNQAVILPFLLAMIILRARPYCCVRWVSARIHPWWRPWSPWGLFPSFTGCYFAA